MVDRSGLILVDKEPGISSAGVVSRVKRHLHLDKIGHAGTLDPFATGLLVCLCGRATRLASIAERGEKEYSGIFRFGLTTSSDDITGEIVERKAVPPLTPEVLGELSARFTGVISQLPPKVSAIKVNGQRAYELARRGETPELTYREVQIRSIELTMMEPEVVSYRIRCSKGTYIRSIARDMGEILGCGGVVETLRREYSHPFSVSDAVRLNDLTDGAIVSWDRLFPSSPRLTITRDEDTALSVGNQQRAATLFARATDLSDESTAVVVYESEAGVARGVLVREGSELRLGVHF